MKKLILTAILSLSFTLVKAQSFLAPTHTPEFTPYQSTVDVKLYEKVITEKQQLYDKNAAKFQTELNRCYEYLADLKQVDPKLHKSYEDGLYAWLKQVMLSNPDWSNIQVSEKLNNSVRQYVEQIKQVMYKTR